MILKKENPATMKRCKLVKLCWEKGLSTSTQLKIFAPMKDKTDVEKESIAEKLFKIVGTSKAEEEMIAKAEKSFLK